MIKSITADFDGVLTRNQQFDILKLAGVENPSLLSDKERKEKLEIIFDKLKEPV